MKIVPWTLRLRSRCLQNWRLFVVAGWLASAVLPGAGYAAQNRLALAAATAGLYQLTNVWTVHLQFTTDQWQAMEPAGGGGMFGGFGGPRGPDGGGGPGGGFGGPRGGGRPGGPGEFGPAMLLAPAFLKQGDQDQDGKLSESEFRGLAGRWFAEWDKEKTGRLNADQLRAGLNTSVPQPQFGPPGGGRPGGGGPRGFNLQGAEGQRNGLASAMGIEFKYVHADLEIAGQVFKDVAVRYKGNGTFVQARGSLKRSLKVQLNEFVKGQRLAGVSTLNLHNNITDASWMNEVLSHRLFRDAGVPAPRTAYARVYVTVPGKHDRQYLGLYSLVEDVDNNFAEARFGTRKGALFKPVTPNLFADLGDDWARYRQTYDPKTTVSPEETGRVIEFAQLVTKADDAAFAARVGEYLDLDEFARFMAVTVWLSTMDSILGPGQNYYLYLHPETRKFQFLPWDLDHSFGQFGMMGSQEQRENLSLQHPWLGENRFLERVFKVDAFQRLYLARLAEFSRTLFKPERFHRQVDEVAAAIRPSVKEESAEKLARFDQVVAGESAPQAGFGGGFFQSAKPIKTFVTARARSVQDQLAGKSVGQTIGDFGFGGRGGRGGAGGPGRFGPGMFLGGVFLSALDANHDEELTREEFMEGFATWFAKWRKGQSGLLTEEQLRAGINEDLSPLRGGGPPGFGPPPGAPPP